MLSSSLGWGEGLGSGGASGVSQGSDSQGDLERKPAAAREPVEGKEESYLGRSCGAGMCERRQPGRQVNRQKCRDKRVLVRRNTLEQAEGKELRWGLEGRAELGCEGVVKREKKHSSFGRRVLSPGTGRVGRDGNEGVNSAEAKGGQSTAGKGRCWGEDPAPPGISVHARPQAVPGAWCPAWGQDKSEINLR